MNVINKSFPAVLFFAMLLAVVGGCKQAESTGTTLPPELLQAAHEAYREPEITHRRFTHDQLQPLIQKHADSFSVEPLGTSVEGRAITSLTWGSGERKVLLWSQMHGNESTATMALFDLFNFLEASGDEFEDIRERLKSSLQLKFIPMLNPDGAEVFERRNALGIDLNRDAVSQISPEAVILKSIRDQFEPDFGFNLHDQQVYYNVSKTPKQATISVLAPGYNYARDINAVRLRAMQVIVGMNELLQQVIPGQVGKYDDGFEPRAFGDNIQKWGTSTILIESGGYSGDPEKQFIRQLNFMVLLNALHQIAQNDFQQYEQEAYFAIPDNDLKLMDVLLKKVQVPLAEKYYPVDIAIRRREYNTATSYTVRGVVEDLGDMQVYFGMEELDASGLRFEEGNVYEKTFESLSELTEEMALDLLRAGFLAVHVQKEDAGTLHQLPLLVLEESGRLQAGWTIGANPSFFLMDGTTRRYALVNGYLIDLQNPKPQLFMQKVQ